MIKSIISSLLILTSLGSGFISQPSSSSPVVGSQQPRIILAHTKKTCDWEYQIAAAACRCSCKTAYQRNVCWRKASQAYSDCLRSASDGGSGGGSMGGRSILASLWYPGIDKKMEDVFPA